MNGPGLDRDTAERMLRGEPIGPPELTELLAAASAGSVHDDLSGEEAAVAAFHEARSRLHAQPPRARRLLRSRLLTLKTALVGLLLLLVGGVAVAATSQHLPVQLGNRHPHTSHKPTMSPTAAKPLTASASSGDSSDRHAAHSSNHPRKKPHHQKKPHPDKGSKGNPRKGNPHHR
jgi:hypothetical protein